MRVRVPTLVVLGIAEPEVATDVDDGTTFGEPGGRELCGLTRWQSGEHDLGVAGVRAHRERRRRGVKMRLHVSQCLALPPSRGRSDEPRLGMAQEQTRELATCVARHADDRHFHRHRRILCGLSHIYATGLTRRDREHYREEANGQRAEQQRDRDSDPTARWALRA